MEPQACFGLKVDWIWDSAGASVGFPDDGVVFRPSGVGEGVEIVHLASRLKIVLCGLWKALRTKGSLPEKGPTSQPWDSTEMFSNFMRTLPRCDG